MPNIAALFALLSVRDVLSHLTAMLAVWSLALHLTAMLAVWGLAPHLTAMLAVCGLVPHLTTRAGFALAGVAAAIIVTTLTGTLTGVPVATCILS